MKKQLTIKTLVGNLIFISILLLIGTRFLSVWSGTAFPINLISTGSMNPTLMEGDIVTWMPSPVEDVQIGDIIVYKSWLHWPEERFVVHRVTDIKEQWGKPSFVTKGDANNYTDQAGPHIVEPYVTDKNYVGKIVSVGQLPIKIPFVGLIGIWVNEGFKILATPTSSKGSLSYVGVFTPLIIAVVLLIVTLFILPDRVKTNKEKLHLYIFGTRALNFKKTFVTFLLLYIALLSFIHYFAYDAADASLGIGEFPEKSPFQMGSISPGSTSIARNLPVFNPSILPVKGIVIGGDTLTPFVNREVFMLNPGQSDDVAVTATASPQASNGSYVGRVMVYSSPLWFLVPDEILKMITCGDVLGTVVCIDIIASVLLTTVTVLSVIIVNYSMTTYLTWSIDLSWRHRAKLLLKKSVTKQFRVLRKGARRVLGKKVGWVLSINLLERDWKKPVIVSLLFIPLLFLVSSEFLVMVVASLTAGVVAYFISCKQRNKIIIASVIPMLLIVSYTLLRQNYYLVFNSKDMITALTLGIGAVAIYLLVLAFFLIPLALISWYITHQLRNLKEQKDPLLILEGRCDL